MNISTEISVFSGLTVTINGLIHLRLTPGSVAAFQSWILFAEDGVTPEEWVIEYHIAQTGRMKSVYNSREKWEMILKILDTNSGFFMK